VAAIHHLKKCDLRVSCQVNVLSAVSYKLHQTSACHGSFILRQYKKILEKHIFLKIAGEFGIEHFFHFFIILM
jgi:hypothetical protein